MGQSDRLLETIEAVHAAGLEAELWPRALAAITRTVGGVAATLETFDRPSGRITEFHSHGLPAANEIAYFDEYAMRNPRIPLLINGCTGNVVYDYMVLDERTMDRDDFYGGFLAPAGYRYCVGGTLAVSKRESTLFSVQRLRKQGHVERREIQTMRRLLPHVRQAHDVARRLRTAADIRRSLERALACLADGAGLLRADGSLLYANPALQAMARAGDGIRAAGGGKLVFSSTAATARFAEALASARRLRDGEIRAASSSDLAVPRPSGAPPYILSVRPLFRSRRGDGLATRAIAVLFLRDPSQRHFSSTAMLRDVFDLTAAEAGLARAMQAGISPVDYARQHGLSFNTVYTHLRRIKDKTGCRRQTQLVRRLNDVLPPLRTE